MKRTYVLAVIAAIVLGLTGLAYAQQGYFNAEEGNGKWSAVEPPVSPADAHYEYFNAEIANSAPLSVPPVAVMAVHEHAGKSDTLKIAETANLGGVALQPGKYDVRHIDSGKEHFVEFAQTVENDYAPEGVSVYEQQIVATVPSRDVPLNSSVRRTELLSGSNGRITGLKIRGENVEHVFGESAIRVAGTPSPQH